MNEFVSDVERNTGLPENSFSKSQDAFDRRHLDEVAGILISAVNDKDFIERTRNETVLLTDYFGFLRRDPNPDEFANRLSHFRVNDLAERKVEIESFIDSDEYRSRFKAAQ